MGRNRFVSQETHLPNPSSVVEADEVVLVESEEESLSSSLSSSSSSARF